MKVVRVQKADTAVRWYARHVGKDFKFVREYFKNSDELGSIFSGDGYIVIDHTSKGEECWVSVEDGYVTGAADIDPLPGGLFGERQIVVKDQNKYSREIRPGVFCDVYDVIRAFEVADPCLQHLIKKALAAGQRGHKDVRTDYKDILDSANRALEMYDEWDTSVSVTLDK